MARSKPPAIQDHDEPTTLDAGDAALVVSSDGEISFHMPDFGEDDEVPPLVAALGLLAIKLQDEGFVEDLLSELAEEEDDDEDEEIEIEDDDQDDEKAAR